MTKKDLEQIFYLEREIKKDKERLLNLETLATKSTQSINGMPFITDISDKTGRYGTEIAEQKKLIQEKMYEYVAFQNEILKFINGIDDSLVRQIMKGKYIDRLSWAKIALSVGGPNTAGSVRMIHNRFLKKQRQRD